MNPKQLRELIIRPTLHTLNAWSPAAEDLMMGTAAQESHCGRYIRQVGCSGMVGAFGVWQMELATARDIYDNYLRYKPELKVAVEKLRGAGQSITDALTSNLAYACAWGHPHRFSGPSRILETILQHQTRQGDCC